MLTNLASPDAAATWLAAQVSGSLRTDSRAVRAGDGFIAWPGHAVDGRRFVGAALDGGAAACLVERQGVESFAFDDRRIACFDGLKAASGAIAHLYHGKPSETLRIVASTGTNGKTSTAWWTAQSLTQLGRRCGIIGTLGVGEPPAPGASDASGCLQSTGLTTPDPVTLHAALRTMLDQGFKACAIEASSIGLVEQRLQALHIEVALFTNFTQDHLDFHGSMAAYWAAKRSLFSWPGLKAAVLNIDDAQGAALADELKAGALDLWTVSLRGAARLRAGSLAYVDAGLAFDVIEGDQRARLRSRLVGDFNASNLLVVIGALRALGVSLADAAAAAASLTPVPGRLQPVGGQGVEVVVDYAHTPDALDQALQALRPLADARNGRLWCVFGCGGNRDAGKRALMGAIAARRADRVVITSDNPRNEEPGTILAQILAGVSGHDQVAVIEDRREAIRSAVARAGSADVILLAGKGHEEHQEVAGVKRPFSDVQEARAALSEREGARP